MSTRQLLLEPLDIHFSLNSRQRQDRVNELLEAVHLPESILKRLPSELSGGQRQRLLIARSLAVDPQLLICDEPVSALDVSIQAKLLQLLMEIKKQRNLTVLFISHDLAVVQSMADNVLVLQKGHAVEYESCEKLFEQPRHAYTKMLIDACPKW
jgi:ABC-type oligopeptide transport system ATPase subunit